jgi:hypothetical protein
MAVVGLPSCSSRDGLSSVKGCMHCKCCVFGSVLLCGQELISNGRHPDTGCADTTYKPMSEYSRSPQQRSGCVSRLW